MSFVLIGREFHQSNRITSKFCKQGTQIDCDKVVGSCFSKIFGFISWAELGAVWFITSPMWVSLSTWLDIWVSPLWYFVLVALLFTLWSLSIQAFVIQRPDCRFREGERRTIGKYPLPEFSGSGVRNSQGNGSSYFHSAIRRQLYCGN
ncbi:MAG: vitamin K epoxide reductase family protein [Bacteroidales bacterium]|nr:vitamin K epoxide reductase family protein [Bacteroidales bacterium]